MSKTVAGFVFAACIGFVVAAILVDKATSALMLGLFGAGSWVALTSWAFGSLIEGKR